MEFLQVPSLSVNGALQSDLFIFMAITVIAVTNLAQAIIAENRKRKDRQQQSLMKETLFNIERYLKILSEKYTEELTDLQMPIVVDEFCLHMRETIINECWASITKNDIRNNGAETSAKLESFVCNRYKELVTNLGRFKWRGRHLSELVDMSKKMKITENVLEIVIKERSTKEQYNTAYANIKSSVSQRCDELRNDIKSKAYG